MRSKLVGERRFWSRRHVALGVVLAVVVVNLLSARFYFRLDLTSDGRYTLTDYTKQQLAQLGDPVYIRCYLEGSLPLEFARLRLRVEDMLEEYRVASGHRVHYQFDDPNGESDASARDALREQLLSQGARPLTVHERATDGGSSESLVFPTLTVGYRGRQTTINVVAPQATLGTEASLAAAIQNLEYRLTTALERVVHTARPKLAFLEGHGTLEAVESISLSQELSADYQVVRVPISDSVGSLDGYSVVILADPQEAFTEREKLVLDQYLMHGGSLLLLISPVQVLTDSLEQGASTLAMARSVNLDDQLFRYGLRLTPVLLQDMQCAMIPVNTALAGQPARFTPMPWPYCPLLTPSPGGLATRHVELVYSQYPGRVEIVGGQDGLEKQVLLTTSAQSRERQVPCLVSLEELQSGFSPEQFNAGRQSVGVMVTGRFASAFQHRPLAQIAPGEHFEFKAEGEEARLALFADGILGRNSLQRMQGSLQPLPVGYDRYMRRTFGNAELLQNTVYLLDGREGLLSLRGRRVATCRLAPVHLQADPTLWQALNVALPFVLLLALGGLVPYFRTRRYGGRKRREKGRSDGGE